MEFDLFETLKKSFDTSTFSNNRFKTTLDSISWDHKFFADEEYYFCKGGFIFTTPSLNPFKISRNWRPGAIFSDGSMIDF